MEIKTIDYSAGRVRIIDQTKLPGRLEYIYINDVKAMWKAIKIMQVRGAPALAAAAATGVYLAVKDSRAVDFIQFKKELDRAIRYIAGSRPTAKNLFWGLERVWRIVSANQDQPVSGLKQLILRETKNIISEDQAACRKIGSFGQRLIRDKDNILTVCNAGILATIDYGTALGVIYRAKEKGKKIKVFACETRPLLQGARLTTWELKQRGVDVTLICDNMAATLMRQGQIEKVIAGADRIAANGDTANKIGTYSLAVLSRYHRIPFYIAAPASTFDLSIKNGRGIPIEERDIREVSQIFFKRPIVCSGVKIYNPAFDVTPHHLISAIITDKGLIRAPFARNIKRFIGQK